MPKIEKINIKTNGKIAFRLTHITLLALLLALPVTYLLGQSQQDIRQRAESASPQKVVISGNLNTWVGNQPTRLSAELLDQNGHPIKTGVTYEWGISSKYSVGTLKEVNQNIASFYPQNVGTGDIYVKVTFTLDTKDKVFIGSVPVIVNQSNSLPTVTPSATLMPTPHDSPRPFYTVYDLYILLKNYLTNADIMYQPQDQKVNMWDGAYVINFLIKKPDLCQVCTTDLDCSLGYYCTDTGFCLPRCLRQSPPCLMPEPVCN